MTLSESIVNPVRCSNDNYLPGMIAIMTATESDFKLMNHFSSVKCIATRKLYTSLIKIYENRFGLRYSIVGPFIGAPYAVMILETLFTWGVKQLVFVGWCGSISDNLEIGNLIVPNGAIVDEGTSKHYFVNERSIVAASQSLSSKINTVFKKNDIIFCKGLVWTTDAIFRETTDKIKYFKKVGALAVEMELSAILSISKFRNIKSAGILIVSDAIRGSVWHSGFKSKSFKQTRNNICKIIDDLCCELI